MGHLALKRIMSMQRERKRKRKRNRREIQAHHGSIASLARRARRDDQPCQQDDNLGPPLPEDIWCRIHSLVPLRDAARAACVSRAFLRSWRCYPNLNFSKETVYSKENLPRYRLNSYNISKGSTGWNDRRDYNRLIDHALTYHSRVGVKTLKLQFYGPYNLKSYYRLNSWLQIAVTPGIEELTLWLSSGDTKYNFPCSLLSGSSGNSIRYLHLFNCAFHPIVEPGWLRSLTMLHLFCVSISEDELGCLLSNSFALEQLKLIYCHDIIRLEIPYLLQRLSYLEVSLCWNLQVIENKAPNISTFRFSGNEVQLSLGESLQVKNLNLDLRCVVCYALAVLPSTVPNLETLAIRSTHEMVNAPIVPSKFLHLKCLTITIKSGKAFPWDYDYLSLVSFLDACPYLETFILRLSFDRMHHFLVGDQLNLRQTAEHHHSNLKSFRITGFCAMKSLVELTCHILENATSLECLTLDTTLGNPWCSDSDDVSAKCIPLGREFIREVPKAILAVRRYIEGKVPSTIKFNVVEPCSRCPST